MLRRAASRRGVGGHQPRAHVAHQHRAAPCRRGPRRRWRGRCTSRQRGRGRPIPRRAPAQQPRSPVWRMIQSSARSTCLSTYGSPSITTRSKRAPDFESAHVIGTRLDAPATSSSTEAATGRGVVTRCPARAGAELAEVDDHLLGRGAAAGVGAPLATIVQAPAPPCTITVTASNRRPASAASCTAAHDGSEAASRHDAISARSRRAGDAGVDRGADRRRSRRRTGPGGVAGRGGRGGGGRGCGRARRRRRGGGRAMSSPHGGGRGDGQPCVGRRGRRRGWHGPRTRRADHEDRGHDRHGEDPAASHRASLAGRRSGPAYIPGIAADPAADLVRPRVRPGPRARAGRRRRRDHAANGSGPATWSSRPSPTSRR